MPGAGPMRLFCSGSCRTTYSKKAPKERKEADWPSVTFDCAQCGKTVTTTAGGEDRRMRFCSAACRRKYWRHSNEQRKGTPP